LRGSKHGAQHSLASNAKESRAVDIHAGDAQIVVGALDPLLDRFHNEHLKVNPK